MEGLRALRKDAVELNGLRRFGSASMGIECLWRAQMECLVPGMSAGYPFFWLWYPSENVVRSRARAFESMPTGSSRRVETFGTPWTPHDRPV